MRKLFNQMMEPPQYPVLSDAMLVGLAPSKHIYPALAKMFLVVIGSFLLAVSARFQFTIPLSPVPVTGQTLVVLLIGMTYGPRLAGATLIAYLFEGVVLGWPVFANGGFGLKTLLGPTWGYLVGFLVASVVMGVMAERGMGRSIITTLIAMITGNAIIYLLGAAWLVAGAAWVNQLGIGVGLDVFQGVAIEKVFAIGVQPYLYGDVLKLIVAAVLMPLAWHFVKGLQK